MADCLRRLHAAGADQSCTGKLGERFRARTADCGRPVADLACNSGECASDILPADEMISGRQMSDWCIFLIFSSMLVAGTAGLKAQIGRASDSRDSDPWQ